MQIAEIAVKTRTGKGDVFDYEIPPHLLPQIKLGIMVEVPFHGRNVYGIIVGLKRKSQINFLKKIMKVIDENPAIDYIHIELSKWMSNYYLTPLGQTIFENTVPPAKRLIKSIIQKSLQTDKLNTLKNLHDFQRFLIVADFTTRLKFYLKAIDKTVRQGRKVIILSPDLSLIPYFSKMLNLEHSILHANLTISKRWAEWNRIRAGKVDVVVGSQSALFAPLDKLGLIIIDQEDNETYKNDRAPRYHTINVAEKLAALSRANIILGSLTPRIEDYWRYKKNKFKLYKKENVYSQATIVNMNTEKSAISKTLETSLVEILSRGGKILLLLNRKGDGTKFACAECGWISTCAECNLPLTSLNSKMICFRCERSYQQKNLCPVCHSIKLRPFGLGTSRLKKILNMMFPKKNIVVVEKDGIPAAPGSKWDIAVITSYALKFRWPHIDLVGIVDADQSLILPDFNASQKSFQTIYKFLRLSKKKIIQTHLPNNEFIKQLSKMDYESFFESEIEERKKNHFPPFWQILKLEYRHSEAEKCLEQVQKAYKDINRLTHLDRSFEISLPHAPFFPLHHGKTRYQIIIKMERKINPELAQYIRGLPKGWIVDLDPIALI